MKLLDIDILEEKLSRFICVACGKQNTRTYCATCYLKRRNQKKLNLRLQAMELRFQMGTGWVKEPEPEVKDEIATGTPSQPGQVCGDVG